jgi:phenylacetate-coenzyme A ligase PaaK-like adenylate-forming protein
MEADDPAETVVSKVPMMSDLTRFVASSQIRIDDIKEFVASTDNIGKRFLEKYVVLSTSGTTGVPGYFLWDVRHFGCTRGIFYQRLLAPYVGLTSYLKWFFGRSLRCCAVVNRVHSAGLLGILHMPWLIRRMFRYKILDLGRNWTDIVDEIAGWECEFLFTYPSVLEILLGHWEERQRFPKINFIITVWERVPTQLRARMKAAMPEAKIIESYSSTECSSMGIYCELGQLHWNEDACHIQSIAEDGTPVSAGTFGDAILVTNFYNRVQPIVRYRVEDRLRIVQQPCPCGSPFRVLELSGRTEDVLILMDSSGHPFSLLPIMIETNVFLKMNNVSQFQVIQTGAASITVRMVLSSGDQTDTATRVKRGFDELITRQGLSADIAYEL